MTSDPLITLSQLVAWVAGFFASVAYVLGWVLPELPMLATTSVILAVVCATALIRGWMCRVVGVVRLTSGLARPDADLRPMR